MFYSFRFLIKSLTLTLIYLVALGACSFTSVLSSGPVLSTKAGEIRGSELGSVHSFKGIPYAQPPLGDLRWRSPKPFKAWEGIRNVKKYGPNCAQLDNDFLWFDLGNYSEDCLNLNVWTPSIDDVSNLPVMVWIHGGGYVNGSGNIPRLNSPGFSQRGVVLVTFNYRLTAFGFMTHPALAATNPMEPNGNYALQDVLLALRWVQENIRAFGGDPSNVTIFGESAGAGIVNTLLVLPDAKDLFHKAISQSSSVGLAPEPFPDKRAGFNPPSDKAGITLAKRAGIPNHKSSDPAVAQALRAMTTDELLAIIDFRDRYTPVVDGKLLPEHVGMMFAAGKQHAVPYITGAVSWEASLGRSIGGPFSPENLSRIIPNDVKQELYPNLLGNALEDAVFGDIVINAASDYVSTEMQRQKVNVYRYYFSYLASARRNLQPGVAHADDIAFVLGTLEDEKDLTEISFKDKEMTDLMQSYWLQFARTGNPNMEGLPSWPNLSSDASPVLEIGDEIVVRQNFLTQRLDHHVERSKKLLERSQ